jgi:hypothetical protein
MNYKTICKRECCGRSEIGIEILVAVTRPFTEADERAADKACDELQRVLETETLRLDPHMAVEIEVERQQLLGLFAGADIFAEAIPNGYASDLPYYSSRPWFVVTTKKGRITLGWRKRVIEIRWDPCVAMSAEILFSEEQVTKAGRLIHAWGYEKAQEYIRRLLA